MSGGPRPSRKREGARYGCRPATRARRAAPRCPRCRSSECRTGPRTGSAAAKPRASRVTTLPARLSSRVAANFDNGQTTIEPLMPRSQLRQRSKKACWTASAGAGASQGAKLCSSGSGGPRIAVISASSNPASSVASRCAAARSARLIRPRSARSGSRQPETPEDGVEDLLLDRFIGFAHESLEGRNEVADHIFRRIVQQGREPAGPAETRLEMTGQCFDEQRMLCHRQDVRPAGLAVPAGHAGQTMRDVVEVDIVRRGRQKIEAASRQHPLPGPRGRRDRAHASPMTRWTPSAMGGAPSAAASATRSIRTMARPRPLWLDPMVPTTISPTVTSAPTRGPLPRR